MKKFLTIFLLIGGLLTIKNSQAQVSFSFNINAQPAWGPSGYNYAEYYYLPDMDAYYYVPSRQFVFFQGGNWVFMSQPPVAYRNINLYHTYKVVINQPRPYLNHGVYHDKYIPYRNYHTKQRMIDDNPGRGNGHYKNYDNAHHENYNGHQGNDHGKNGHGNGGHGNEHGGGKGH